MERGERSSGDFQIPTLPPLSSHVSGQSATTSGHPTPPSSSSHQALSSPLYIAPDLPSSQPHNPPLSPLLQPSPTSRNVQPPPASTPPPVRVCSGQAPPPTPLHPAPPTPSSPQCSSPIPCSFNLQLPSYAQTCFCAAPGQIFSDAAALSSVRGSAGSGQPLFPPCSSLSPPATLSWSSFPWSFKPQGFSSPRAAFRRFKHHPTRSSAPAVQLLPSPVTSVPELLHPPPEEQPLSTTSQDRSTTSLTTGSLAAVHGPAVTSLLMGQCTFQTAAPYPSSLPLSSSNSNSNLNLNSLPRTNTLTLPSRQGSADLSLITALTQSPSLLGSAATSSSLSAAWPGTTPPFTPSTLSTSLSPSPPSVPQVQINFPPLLAATLAKHGRGSLPLFGSFDPLSSPALGAPKETNTSVLPSILGPPPSLKPPTHSKDPPHTTPTAPNIPNAAPTADGVRRKARRKRTSAPPPSAAPLIPKLPTSSLPKRVVGDFQGMPSVCFTDEELRLAETEFQHSLVLKFVQRNPSLALIRASIAGWGLSSPYSVGILDRRHTFVHLTSPADLATALSTEIQRIDGHLFRRFRWTPDFSTITDSSRASVWLTLPRLPIALYLPSYLECIGDAIGTFLRLDIPTLAMTKLRCARMCVEIDCVAPPPSRIWIAREGGEGFWQAIEYESLPRFCSHCRLLGHDLLQCRRSTAAMQQEEGASPPRAVQTSQATAAPSTVPPPLQPVHHPPTEHSSPMQLCTAAELPIAAPASPPPQQKSCSTAAMPTRPHTPPSPLGIAAPLVHVDAPHSSPLSLAEYPPPDAVASHAPSPPLERRRAAPNRGCMPRQQGHTHPSSFIDTPSAAPMAGHRPRKKAGPPPCRLDGKSRKRELFRIIREASFSPAPSLMDSEDSE